MLVKMQALCYARYCFMDFVDKWPGSICDSTIFYNFKVNEMQKDGIISFMRKVVVDDVSPVPRCILGDPSYCTLFAISYERVSSRW